MIDLEAPPHLPGFVLERRIGVGEHQVWRALDLGPMRPVAVQVGPRAGRPGSVAREAAQLRRIHHANVARPRAVIDLPDGRRAIVLDLAPEADLATLVAGRAALPAGEVVTVAIALARALEHVHALGLAAGPLSPDEVIFAPDGRPVLAGVGVPWLLAGSPPSVQTYTAPTYPVPADDVRALGEVLRFALTGRPDAAVAGPLAPLVTLCLASDPAGRPSPPQLAVMARDAAAAVPVRLASGRPTSAEPHPWSIQRAASSRVG